MRGMTNETAALKTSLLAVCGNKKIPLQSLALYGTNRAKSEGNSYNFVNSKEELIMEELIYIKEAQNRGSGVFASRDISKDEIISN